VVLLFLVSNAAHRNDERQERHPYFQLHLEHSHEPREGTILDYDKSGRLLSIELLDASEQVK
jgi:YD repeat-containing protein